jgi:hypothetical protein
MSTGIAGISAGTCETHGFCLRAYEYQVFEREPDFTGGRTWFLLKATSTGRPVSRAFVVKGERPDRTAEHKKKTMKTNTNKNQKKAQSRPEQLSTDKAGKERPKIDMALRRLNRALDTEKLLTLLRTDAPDFFALAEVVGKWVWIQFTEKQPPQVTRVLAELVLLTPQQQPHLNAGVTRSHGKQPQLQQVEREPIVAPKIIRRKQAAERLNSSLRFVDLIARQGILKKCILPGRKRAVGILESSLSAVLSK